MVISVCEEAVIDLRCLYGIDAYQTFCDAVDSFLDDFVRDAVVTSNERFDLIRSIDVEKGVVTMKFLKISN